LIASNAGLSVELASEEAGHEILPSTDSEVPSLDNQHSKIEETESIWLLKNPSKEISRLGKSMKKGAKIGLGFGAVLGLGLGTASLADINNQNLEGVGSSVGLAVVTPFTVAMTGAVLAGTYSITNLWVRTLITTGYYSFLSGKYLFKNTIGNKNYSHNDECQALEAKLL